MTRTPGRISSCKDLGCSLLYSLVLIHGGDRSHQWHRKIEWKVGARLANGSKKCNEKLKVVGAVGKIQELQWMIH